MKRKIVIYVLLLILVILIASAIVIGMKSNLSDEKAQETTAKIGEIEPREVDTSIWDTEKVEIYTDEAGEVAPVPKGYVVSGKDDEHTVNTGLVIYEGEIPVTNENAWEESKTRNQWVWVPVPDVSRIYEEYNGGAKKAKLYSYNITGRSTYTNGNYEPGIIKTYDNEKYFAKNGKQGMTQEKWLQEMQLEYERMIESVEKYGGYYIGRYETGNVMSNNYKEPVVRRMNTSINYVTWYQSYENLKKIKGTNEEIHTDMIWGCLWDETLQWLVDSGSKTYGKLYNSKDWGVHSDSKFDYITTSGETVHRTTGTRIPTGSSEQSKANNIYDLAGNVLEWTLEVGDYAGAGRAYRGGNYFYDASTYGASSRTNHYPYDSSANVGVRAYFYIK